MPPTMFVYNNINNMMVMNNGQGPPPPPQNVSLPGATPGDQYDDADYEDEEYGTIPASYKLPPQPGIAQSPGELETNGYIGGGIGSFHENNNAPGGDMEDEDSDTNDVMWDPNARKISHETRR